MTTIHSFNSSQPITPLEWVSLSYYNQTCADKKGPQTLPQTLVCSQSSSSFGVCRPRSSNFCPFNEVPQNPVLFFLLQLCLPSSSSHLMRLSIWSSSLVFSSEDFISSQNFLCRVQAQGPKSRCEPGLPPPTPTAVLTL